MQYNVRNRRRLRTTEQPLAARTSTQRGTGLADRLPADVVDGVVVEPTARVRAKGTGSHSAQAMQAAQAQAARPLVVKEVVSARARKKSSQR